MRSFSYSRPSTPDEAVQTFAAATAGARYVAGGTTLYDLMKVGIEQPTHLIDVTALSGLAEIDVSGDTLRFGALASMSAVADDPVVARDYPLLAESLQRAASPQLRNMATVGGNLLQRTRCMYFRNGAGSLSTVGRYPCNKREPGSGCAAIGGLDRGQAVLGQSEACTAVSPGDWPVALVAMDASVELLGPGGGRTMPVGLASTYHKVRDRESYAFALASAAVALDIDGDRVRRAHVALGGVASRPWRAPQAEAVLTGEHVTAERALAAGRAAFEGARSGTSNGFKIELGARTIADAVMIAMERNAR